MTRRVLGVLLLGSAGAVPAVCQAPTLVVEARDATDHTVIVHARARLLLTGGAAVADTAGRIMLAAPEQADTLLISALGYAAVRRPLAAGAAGALRVLLSPVAAVLPEIVTTVGGRERDIAEATASIISIPQREIAAQAATAVAQVVAELPGVQQGGGFPAGSTLYIRGLGASRVLLLVDGQPVGGPMLENRDLSRTSTLAVERIEVTKGPGSLEHGSDAIGGVINVITAPPEGPLRVSAEGRAGTGGRREGGIALVRGGGLGLRLAAGWRQSDQVAGLDSAGTAFERVWDVRGTARSAVAGAGLRVDGSYDRTRQRWPISGGFNAFVDTWGANVLAEGTLHPAGGTLRLRAAGQHFSYRYRQARGGQPIASDSSPEQTERSLRSVVAFTRPIGAHLLDVGVEGAVRRVDAPGRISDDVARDETLEAFAQDGWRLGSWYLTGGARLSTNSRWGTALTPSVGVAWQVTPSLRWRAMVARGFRGPSFKELAWTFSNPAAGYVIQGNPDLRPERSWSYSTGAVWGPGSWRLGVDLYRNSLRDLIDFANGGSTPAGLLILEPRNVDRARTEGLELEVRRASGPWIMAAGYDYLRARDLGADLPLDRRAAHTGRLRVTRLLGFMAGGTFDVTARYTGSASIVGTVGGQARVTGEREAFFSTDLQLAGSLTGGVGFNLGVDNVFDARPADWPGRVERRFYLGLRGEFAP